MVQEAKPQMELGETAMENAELEELLGKRAEYIEGKKAFNKADKAAKEKIRELGIGGIVRLGRWKITIAASQPREVEFTTEAGTTIRIKEDGAK